jgi:AGCS family alanine or glycine:cation symporter
MDAIMKINGIVNGIVWGPPILLLIVGTGIYFTIRTNCFSIVKMGYVLKNTLLKMFSKDEKGEGEVSAFQAVSTALAATVGTGNIAGVATAIAMGGPGAVFWMWFAALVGMTTKFAEVVLAVHYRETTPDGRVNGGPMYYITKGLGWKWLATLFAVFGAFAAFGIGNMVQSNSIAEALNVTFGLPKLGVGIFCAVFAAIVVVGGIKRIGQVTEIFVPFMAAFYIIGALVIVIVNITHLPAALLLIIKSAFTPAAATGGFAGSTVMLAMRYGVARGVFTNEAGLGSAPIAHAAATTDHPVRQGLWGCFEVWIDTLIIATLTALAIILTGAWETGLSGASLTTEAFNRVIPVYGGWIVSIGLFLFAFSTILGWEYYGERCAEYLFGPKVNMIYRILWIPFIVIGSVGGLNVLWDLADTLNGLMAIPNLIGLVFLSPVVLKLTKEYFAKEKSTQK